MVLVGAAAEPTLVGGSEYYSLLMQLYQQGSKLQSRLLILLHQLGGKLHSADHPLSTGQ